MSLFYSNKKWNLKGLKDAEYLKGSIIRVNMLNFLTYDSCEVFPGPRLNIIMGPNGTGKSTVTHAICLACGGNPATLGRTTDLTQFVKHGKEGEDCFVEVDVLRDSDVLTVKRTFSSEVRSCRFFINGAQSTLQKVREEMERLSIDMDNLCTFMPQDRVGSFSMQTPKGILEKTLEAIKTPDSSKSYRTIQMELADVEKHKANKKQELDIRTGVRNTLQTRVNEMQVQMEILQQREEIQEKLSHYKHCIIVQEAQQAEVALLEKQKLVDEADTSLFQAKAEIQPLETAERQAKKNLVAAEQFFDGVVKRKRAFEDKQGAYHSSLDELALELDCSKGNFEASEKKQREALGRRDAVQKTINQLEKELTKARDRLPEINGHLKEINENMQKFNATAIQHSADMDGIRHQLDQANETKIRATAELNNLKDVEQIYRQKLLSGNRNPSQAQQATHTLQAMDLVAKMRRGNAFSGEVLGPVAMHLKVNDPACAAIIEKIVPVNRMYGFVARNESDGDLLKAEFLKARLTTNIYTMNNTSFPKPPPVPQMPMDIGVQGYIGDQVQCPDLIRAFLNNFHYLHSTLWCRLNDRHPAALVTDKVSEALLNWSRAQGLGQQVRLYTDRVKPRQEITEYIFKVSNYAGSSNAITQSSQGVTGKNMISNTSDSGNSAGRARIEDEIQKQKDAIGRLEKEMATKRAALEASQNQATQLKANRAEALKLLQVPKDLDRKLQTENGKLNELNRLLSDGHEREREKLLKEYSGIWNRALTQSEKFIDVNRDCMEIRVEDLLASRAKADAAARADAASDRVAEAKEALKQFEETVRLRKLERADAEKKRNETKEKVNEIVKVTDDDDEATVRRKEAAFEVYYLEKVMATCGNNTSMRDLLKKHDELEVQLSGIVENDGAKPLFEKYQRELAGAIADVIRLQEAYDHSHQDLEKQSAQWLTDVHGLAATINTSFKEFMGALQYQGEAALVQRGTFADFEMEMKVAFRDSGDLVPLSGTRHSGGERAVSTIMYLMALQSLTTVPFRMVDEINQGMDERNERLVFDRIVQSCCNDPRQPHQKLKPQYFLVTPKLLPAMRAMEHDDITVLMVYNGPGLQFDWVRGNPIFVAASAIASNRSAMTSSSSVKGPTTSSFSSSVVKDERILGKRVAESDHSDEKKKMAPSLQNLIKIQSDNIVKHELVSKSATSKPVITKPSQSSSSLVPMKFERQVFEILDSDEEDPKSKRVKQDKSEQKENMRANSSSLGGARRGEVIFVD